MKPINTDAPIMVHEMFSEERIAFNREVGHHTELCSYLVALGANTEGEVVGVVASYLQCELENEFTPEDMASLYTKFTGILKQMRVQDAGIKLLGIEESADELS